MKKNKTKKLKNRGFTLIEIIVALTILVIVVIVVGVSINKVKENKKDAKWNYLVDRIKSSANSVVTSSNNNFMVDQEEQFLSVNQLIDSGLLDKDGIKSPYDNINVIDNADDDYHYARVFVNENEAIEVEYPTKIDHYIVFNPKLSIVLVNENVNLLSEDVKLCDRNNECGNIDATKVTIYNDESIITNVSSYKFTRAGKYVIKYTYFENKKEKFDSYRIYIVRESDCNLIINNGATTSRNKTVSLSLIGNNIKKYKLSENPQEGSLINYTSNVLPNYTFSSNGEKTLFVTCYYDDFLTYSNGSSAKINIKNDIPKEYTYNYTGYEQNFIVPVAGKYKLEVWGASGGQDGGHPGGKGGYASGIGVFKENEQLFIYVGGAGGNQGSGSGLGGYNGGGRGGYNEGGGGGGSDVRYLGNGIDNRIIIGGGGGGAGWWDTWAGAGGASNSGNNNQLFYGSSVGCPGRDGCGAGGGGGYYGGKLRSGDYGAYGGSSFVNEIYLNNPTDTAGVQEGNGLVKITILDN